MRLQKEEKFLETAKVFENFYGTLKDEVLENLKKTLIFWRHIRFLCSFIFKDN